MEQKACTYAFNARQIILSKDPGGINKSHREMGLYRLLPPIGLPLNEAAVVVDPGGQATGASLLLAGMAGREPRLQISMRKACEE
jgi:hypothetical protein